MKRLGKKIQKEFNRHALDDDKGKADRAYESAGNAEREIRSLAQQAEQDFKKVSEELSHLEEEVKRSAESHSITETAGTETAEIETAGLRESAEPGESTLEQQALAAARLAVEQAKSSLQSLAGSKKKIEEEAASAYQGRRAIDDAIPRLSTAGAMHDGQQGRLKAEEANTRAQTLLTQAKTVQLVEFNAAIKAAKAEFDKLRVSKETPVGKELDKEKPKESTDRKEATELRTGKVSASFDRNEVVVRTRASLLDKEQPSLEQVVQEIFVAIDKARDKARKSLKSDPPKPTIEDLSVVLDVLNEVLGPTETTQESKKREDILRPAFGAWLVEQHYKPQSSSEVGASPSGQPILHASALAESRAAGLDSVRAPTTSSSSSPELLKPAKLGN